MKKILYLFIVSIFIDPGMGLYARVNTSDSAPFINPEADTQAPEWSDTAQFAVHSYNSTGVYLYWKPAVTDDVGITRYLLYYNDTLYTELNAYAGYTEYTQDVRYLIKGNTYTFKVEAKDAAGNISTTGPSTTVLFDPDSAAYWPQEAVLEATDITISSVMLNWTKAVDNLFVERYRVKDQTGDYNTISYKDPYTEADSFYLLEYLEPDTEYTFTVFAYDGDYNESAPGPEVTIRTLPDTIPPYWVEGNGITACMVGPDYIGLRWDEAEDNVGIAEYQLFQDDTLIKTYNRSSFRYSCLIKDLKPGTTYSYKIVAVDGSGNSNEGLNLLVNTLNPPPAPVFLPNTAYEFISIGDKNYSVTDINDSGQLTGSFYDGYSTKSFIWENGTMKDLGALSTSSPSCNAYFINNAGQIAGESRANNGDYHTFFWENDTIRDIGTLNGNWIKPTALNDSGTVVGWSRYASFYVAGFEKAYRYNRKDGIIDLGTLGGEVHMSSWERVISYAKDINNQGQIVGYSPAPVDGEAVRHGFIWENGVMQDLDPENYVNPLAINNPGQIAGYFNNQTIIWSAGEITYLGTLGGYGAVPYGINDNGVVYGNSGTDIQSCDGANASHAFIYKDNLMIDLGTLGGGNSNVVDMNNNNQVVGWGETYEGLPQAFLWDNGLRISLHPDGFHESRAVKINESGQVLVNAVIIDTAGSYEGGEPRTERTNYAFLVNPVEVPEITITSVDEINLCRNSSFELSYISSGNFNENNEFIVQLSLPGGNLHYPVDLYCETVSTGRLKATVPSSVADSLLDIDSSYNIRIISTNPVSISDEYRADKLVKDCPPEFLTALPENSYCAGEEINISVMTDGTFNSGNSFTAYLSDETGSFDQGNTLGFVNANDNCEMTVTLPEDLKTGNKYRLKVTASDPDIVSSTINPVSVQALPSAVITREEDLLVASDGDAYSWIFEGDTLEVKSQSIPAETAGDYRVLVSVNGCAAVSEPYTLILSALTNEPAEPVNIYPNPSKGIFYIKAPSEWYNKKLQIIIYDIHGKSVYNESMVMDEADKREINVSNLSEGIYFLSIFSSEEELFAGKIIIN